MTNRTCTHCHQTKPTNEYPLDTTTNKPRSWCKQCYAHATRQYQETLTPEQQHKRQQANSEWQYAAQLTTLNTATRYGHKWTQHEDNFLHNNHKTMTNTELACKLNRSYRAVTNRKHALGLRKNQNHN